MSLTLNSLASTALSTFKGLAVAAAGTEDGPAAAPAPAVAAPVVAEPASQDEPQAIKGRRIGTVLDAYA